MIRTTEIPDFDKALANARRAAASGANGAWRESLTDAAVDAVLHASRLYNPKRGPFEPFARAFVRSALRRIRHRLRRRWATRPHTEPLDDDDAPVSAPETSQTLPAELTTKLTDPQRAVLELRYSLGCSYAEIGYRRGITKQAAYRIHFRAIQRLRRVTISPVVVEMPAAEEEGA